MGGRRGGCGLLRGTALHACVYSRDAGRTGRIWTGDREMLCFYVICVVAGRGVTGAELCKVLCGMWNGRRGVRDSSAT